MAWYRQRRSELYAQALALLETHPQATFTFSQAAPLREFLAGDPRRQEQVAGLLAEGRLEITGGSETICDLNMCSPAAIVDNVASGLAWFAAELGYRVTVGAFEDAFGVPAQLPALLALFDYRFYKAGRMPRPGQPDLAGDFTWAALDGSVIRCIAPAAGHLDWGWGCHPNPDHPAIPAPAERRARVLAALLPAGDGSVPHRLFTVMGEEQDVVDDLPGILAEATRRTGSEFVFSTYTRYYDALAADHWDTAPRYGPETDLARLFTGCYATRIASKVNARRLEYTIAGRDLAAASGSGAAATATSRQALYTLQFHDAICGCHVDENARFLGQLAHDAGAPRREGARAPEPPALSGTAAPQGVTVGDVRVETTGTGRLAVRHRGRDLGPICHVAAREDNGTLWTEDYSGRMLSLRDDERVLAINTTADTAEVVTLATRDTPHAHWPGFSALQVRKTIRCVAGSASIEVDLELWWLGCATEIVVAWDVAGTGLADCTAEVPCGSVTRRPYTPTPDTMTGAAFPVLNWVRAGAVAVFNRGTPGHVLREGQLETILLRSPVKRWSPWFPVTPSDASHDNGYHRFSFRVDLEAGALPVSALHRRGMRYNLPDPAAMDRCPVLAGLPSNVVAASVRPEKNIGARVLLFEADGCQADWTAPDGQVVQLPAHGIQRVLIHAH